MLKIPIDSKFAGLADRFLRKLPRKTAIPKMVATNDLTEVQPGKWRATGDDPHFMLEFESGVPKGWVYFEAIVPRTTISRAKLYLDRGEGFSEENSIVVPVTRRGYIREILLIPGDTVQLRWDPLETIGAFGHSEIELTEITAFEKDCRCIYRVLYDYARFSKSEERRAAARAKLLMPLVRFKSDAAYQNTVTFRLLGIENANITEMYAMLQQRVKAHTGVLFEQLGQLPSTPTISVVMPVYNTPHTYLREAIRSVMAQLYPHWELMIVDDASTDAKLTRVIEELQAGDSRIKYTRTSSNKGIAAATNSGIAMAQGSYVVFLDHDDILEPQALLRVVQAFEETGASLVYSDEAVMNDDGKEIIDLTLRPGFSPEYLRNHPYIVHLVAFEVHFLKSIGSLDESRLISQDYDLILRAAEKAEKITHIAEVLYRWRTLTGSTGHSRKKDVTRNSVEVLQHHLTRSGQGGSIRLGEHFNYYVPTYEVPQTFHVAIIIPSKNHHRLVRQCIESIEATVRSGMFSVVLVDHESNDPESIRYFKSLANRHQVLRYTGVFNFSSINNWAVKQLTGSYTHYLFLNNDVEAIEHGWLDTMLGQFSEPEVAVVGAHLLYPDQNTIQHAGVCVGMFGAAEHYGKFTPTFQESTRIRNEGYRGALICAHEMSSVTAACMLVEAAAFTDAGGFDEKLAVGFGDVDLCLRILHKGRRVIYSPRSVLIHHESLSRGKSEGDPHPDDSALFVYRWRDFIAAGDPYFNPLFSSFSTSWAYREPLPYDGKTNLRVWHRNPTPGKPRLQSHRLPKTE